MRVAGKIAIVVALAVATHAGPDAAAQDGSQGDIRGYTILFASDSTEPIASGADGERNSAAMARIAKAFGLVLPTDGFKLVFLAPEPIEFELAHDRVKALRRAFINRGVKIEGRTGAVFRSLAVPSDFKPPPRLLADPPRVSSLHLRLLAPTSKQTEGCPWSVRINDPELPPMIGTVPAPLHLSVGARARIAVAAETTSTGVARALWSLRDGQLVAAEPDARSRTGAALPSHDATLHLLLVEREHAALRLIAGLGPAPQPLPELARMLPKPDNLDGRGLGDIVTSLQSTPILRAEPASTLRHCSVSLASRANQIPPPSR